MNEELDTKANKADLAELENRMMQRLQELFNQMRDMFPDKEALKNKLKNMEKSVSAPAR